MAWTFRVVIYTLAGTVGAVLGVSMVVVINALVGHLLAPLPLGPFI